MIDEKARIADLYLAWMDGGTEECVKRMTGVTAEYITSDHSGDCTKQPWTCMRCQSEYALAFADAVLAKPSQPMSASGEPVAWLVDIPSFGRAFFHKEADARHQCHEPGCEGAVPEPLYPASRIPSSRRPMRKTR